MVTTHFQSKSPWRRGGRDEYDDALLSGETKEKMTEMELSSSSSSSNGDQDQREKRDVYHQRQGQPRGRRRIHHQFQGKCKSIKYHV